MIYVIIFVLFGVVVIAPIWLWARRIEKRIEPPDRPGHEQERFHFKYGGEPPGGHGSGTISGAS